MPTPSPSPAQHSPVAPPPASIRRRHLVVRAAELYWVRDMTVEAVGRELAVSRSTVSRLLAQARTEGVVEFVVHPDPDSPRMRAQALDERYRVRTVVADVPSGSSDEVRYQAVGREAAGVLAGLVEPGCTLDVTWGATIEAVSAQLRDRDIADMRVVQMHGSGNVASLGRNYGTGILDRFGAAFGADVTMFPVPAVFDSAATRRLMWEERSIRRVLDLRAGADVLVSSVGVPDEVSPSRLYQSGYLTASDQDELRRERTIGNIASIFFRADGSTDGISVNERSTGMPLEELRQIPSRLFVIADPRKATALHTALEQGIVTHLVTDPQTAVRLLNGSH